MRMKKVVCLYRVSTLQQVSEDDDLPMQRSACEACIAKHEDWELYKEVLEKGVSGFKKHVYEREKLLEIQVMAENKEFDILLVYMSDRIGRKEDETPFYISKLNAMGIEIWSANEGQIKTDEPIDKLLNYIRCWNAEMESRKTALRVKDGQKERIKGGKFVGGTAPYGYDLVLSGGVDTHGRMAHELKINEEAAVVVRMMFDYAVRMEWGAFRIARELNEKGLLSPKGLKWSSNTVYAMLQNPLYKGYLSYEKRANEAGKHTRLNRREWLYSEKPREDLVIVHEDLWERAQRIRESRSIVYKDENGNSVEYDDKSRRKSGQLLLTGLTFCGYCGSCLTNANVYNHWKRKDGTRGKKLDRRYRCSGKKRGATDCPESTYYKADDLEDLVCSQIHTYFETIKCSDVYQDILKMQEDEAKLDKKALEVCKKTVDKIMKEIKVMEDKIPDAMLGNCPFSAEKLSEMIKRKEMELAKAEAELIAKKSECKQKLIKAKDCEDFKELIPSWQEEFANAGLQEKRVMIGKIIERINVTRDSVEIVMKMKMEDFLEVKNGYNMIPPRVEKAEKEESNGDDLTSSITHTPTTQYTPDSG